MEYEGKNFSQVNAVQRYVCYESKSSAKLFHLTDEEELCQIRNDCRNLNDIFCETRDQKEKRFNSFLVARRKFMKIPLELMATYWFHRPDLKEEELFYLVEELIPSTVIALSSLCHRIETQKSNWHRQTNNPLNYLGSWLRRHNPRRTSSTLIKEYTRTCKIGFYQMKESLFGYVSPQLELHKMNAINIFQRHIQQDVIDEMARKTKRNQLAAEFIRWNSNAYGKMSVQIIFNVFQYVVDCLNDKYGKKPFHQLHKFDIAIQQNVKDSMNENEFIEFAMDLLKWQPTVIFNEVLTLFGRCREMHENSLITHRIRDYLKQIFNDLDPMNVKLVEKRLIVQHIVKLFTTLRDTVFARTMRNPIMMPIDNRIDDDRYYLDNFFNMTVVEKKKKKLTTQFKESPHFSLQPSSGKKSPGKKPFPGNTTGKMLDRGRGDKVAEERIKRTYKRRPFNARKVADSYATKPLDSFYLKEPDWKLLEYDEEYFNSHQFQNFIISLMDSSSLLSNIERICEKLINNYGIDAKITVELLRKEEEKNKDNLLRNKAYEIFSKWDQSNSGKLHEVEILSVLSQFEDEKNNYILRKIRLIHFPSNKPTMNRVEFAALLIDYYTLHGMSDNFDFLSKFIVRKLKEAHEGTMKINTQLKWLKSLYSIPQLPNVSLSDLTRKTFDIILQNSIDNNESMLRFYSIAIYYLIPMEEGQAALRVIDSTKPDDQYCKGKVVTPDDCPLMFGCMESGKIIVKTDTAHDKTIFHWIHGRRTINACIAYVPINDINRRSVGVIVVDTYRDKHPEHNFELAELDFFQTTANAFNLAYNNYKRNIHFFFLVKNYINHMFNKYRCIKQIEFYKVKHSHEPKEEEEEECPFLLSLIYHCDGEGNCPITLSSQKHSIKPELFLKDSIFNETIFRCARDGITTISPHLYDISLCHPIRGQNNETSFVFQFIINGKQISVDKIFTRNDSIFKIDFSRYLRNIQRLYSCLVDGTTDSLGVMKYKLELQHKSEIMELLYYKLITKDIYIVLRHFMVKEQFGEEEQGNEEEDEEEEEEPKTNKKKKKKKKMKKKRKKQKNRIQSSIVKILQKILRKKDYSKISLSVTEEIIGYDPTIQLFPLEELNEMIKKVSSITKKNIYEDLLLDWIYVTFQANYALIVARERDALRKKEKEKIATDDESLLYETTAYIEA
ncbi:hypothetical protein SNEBB_007396 [Seison nebaliae]|nr:hypothetical protein SNEBB_007396 [Seison nebaliae]